MTSSTTSASKTSSPERRHGPPRLPDAERAGPPGLLDLRELGNHPLALRYSEVYPFALLRGRLDHGRTQPGLNVAHATPFVIAARLALAHGLRRAGALDLMIDSFRDYYTHVQPRSAAEWLGLDARAHPALRAAPPWAAVFPWRARSLDSYRMAYETAALAENRAVGRDVGIGDGWLFCGPVSAEKMRIEAERVLTVLQHIDADGYRRSDDSDGDVRATALVNDDGDWRWVITAGNHRASAAAALGLGEIPVRVNLVVSRADVRHWRHVREGLYTIDEALGIFDRFFAGNPPPVVHAWMAGDS